MTEPSATAPAKSPPLRFKKVQDDGHIVVYQALVKDLAEPTTTFSLTVTSASAGSEPERTAALERLLAEITATFSFRAEPFTGEPDETTPDPFDPETEVLIQPGLARTARTGLVSVAVTASATTGGGGRDTVGGSYGGKHRWTAGGTQHGTVKPVSGNGWLRPPWRPNASKKISQDKCYPVDTNTFFVGSAKPMTYYVYGGFTLHLH